MKAIIENGKINGGIQSGDNLKESDNLERQIKALRFHI
jgi:hypothetical protein